MKDLVFMLKTYKGDYIYYRQLVETFLKFNADKIPLYVVVPKEDMELFYINNECIYIICEEDIPGVQKNQVGTKYPLGYLNQEIIKLAFWELGLCKNYFCIDADCYFIRYFHKKDFLYKNAEPYTVFYDDTELMAAPYYYNAYGKSREIYNRIIRDELGGDDGQKFFSCHGFAVISSIVMRDMKMHFLEVKGLCYADLINKAPLEFTWYNYYLQKSKIINIYPVSPLMKTYHTQKQLEEEKLRGVRECDLRRYYIGIVLNSNFGREKGFFSYEDMKLKPVKTRLKAGVERWLHW